MKPSSNTTLNSVKFLPAGGVEATWDTTLIFPAESNSDEQTILNTDTRKSSIIKHDYLNNLVLSCRSHLAEFNGIKKECERNITVKSFTFKDLDGSKPQVKIAGKILSMDGSSVPLHTPLINLQTTEYPNKEALAKLVSEIEVEVIAYLFQNKVANPSLFEDKKEIKVA